MASDNRPAEPANQRPPWQQVLLDDIFLALAWGLAVPTLLYIVWGLMDLASVEVFRP